MSRSPYWIAISVAALGCAAAAANLEMFSGNAPVVSPLAPMAPPAAEAVLRTEAAQIDALTIDQLSERQAVWLRDLVAHGAAAGTVRAGIDAVAAWAHQARPLRVQASDIQYLENRARRAPQDPAPRIEIARYWVRQMELERADIPSDKWSQFRIRSGRWVCTGCYAQRGPTETASKAYQNAQAAVDSALAVAPNNAGALFQAAILWNMRFEEPLGTAEARALGYAQRAAAQPGPDAAAARLFALERDQRVEKLLTTAGQLRSNKAVGSKRIVTAFNNGQRAPERDVYQPIFRKATPQELAEADADARQAAALEAEQQAAVNAALRDDPTDPDLFRLLAERPMNPNQPDRPQLIKKERLLRYAILLDPTDWRLHLDRARNWNILGDRPRELASAEAQAVLQHNANGDFDYIYDQEKKKLTADAFLEYVFALQAVRRDPASPFSHQRLAMALQGLILHTINRVPILPDAFQQAVAEMKLTQAVAQRHLEHPEDWRGAQTKQATLQVLDWTRREIAVIPAKPPQ